MRNRILSAALLAMLVIAGGATADMRTDLGAGKATALETAVLTVIPGATLTWEDQVVVKAADGAKSVVALTGDEQEVVDAGTMYVMHIEFTDFATEAIDSLHAFAAEPAPHPTDILAAVLLSPTNAVVSKKVGRLDPTATAIEAKSFDVLVMENGWPSIQVTYFANYSTTDWYGSVRWYAVFDFATMENYSRMPVGVTKARKTGDAIAEQVAAERQDDLVVSIEGGITGQVLSYPCPYPCMFDGRTLLAAWDIREPMQEPTVTE